MGIPPAYRAAPRVRATTRAILGGVPDVGVVLCVSARPSPVPLTRRVGGRHPAGLTKLVVHPPRTHGTARRGHAYGAAGHGTTRRGSGQHGNGTLLTAEEKYARDVLAGRGPAVVPRVRSIHSVQGLTKHHPRLIQLLALTGILSMTWQATSARPEAVAAAARAAEPGAHGRPARYCPPRH